MSQWVFQVLSQYYGIEATDIQPFHNLWKISSAEGDWVLKPYQKSVHKIEWIDYLSEELRRKGFTKFPTPVIHYYGMPWFGTVRQAYVLMNYIDARPATYGNKEDIYKVAKILANFHHHASLIGGEVNPHPIEPIYLKLEERLIRFKNLHHKLSHKRKKDDLAKVVIGLGNDMIQYAEKALAEIDRDNVNRLYQEAIDYRIVSHRDVASHNFLINDKTWIIDFDLSSIDIQALDVWQFINRSMNDWKWDLDVFSSIENEYLRYHPLREKERKLIYQLSLYPNEFFREALGAYERPEKFKKDSIMRIMNKYSDNFLDYQRYQKQLKDM